MDRNVSVFNTDNDLYNEINMKKCYNCGKESMVDVEDIINDIDSYYFVVKGKRCTSCGEEFIDEKEGQKMITIVKKMGIWEISMCK